MCQNRKTQIEVVGHPYPNVKTYRTEESTIGFEQEIFSDISSIPGVVRIEIFPNGIKIVKYDTVPWKEIEKPLKKELKKYLSPEFKKTLLCPHCKNRLNPGDKFCTHCGKKKKVKKEKGKILPFGCFMRILLFAALGLILFSFVGVYIGSHSLDGVDRINLWYEKNHAVAKVDRTVCVKAVYDHEYGDICSKEKDYGLFFENGIHFTRQWTPKERITNIVNRASKSFEYQFGIKLVVVNIEKWDSQNWNSIDLINELKNEISLNDCDLVIGFTGKNSDLTDRGYLPNNGHLGNYVLEGFYVPAQLGWINHIFDSYHLQSYTLTHEVGHTFGALHPEEIYSSPAPPAIQGISDLGPFLKEVGAYLKNNFSVMNAATGILTTHFDERNRTIILGNKYLPSKLDYSRMTWETGFDDGYAINGPSRPVSGSECYIAGFNTGDEIKQKESEGKLLLKNPTYEEMEKFIRKDLTNLVPYDTTHDCGWHSRATINHAKAEGIRIGYVQIYFSPASGHYTGHAIICFNTTDKGMIFVEPQADQIMKVAIGVNYWTDNGFGKPNYGERIGEIQIRWPEDKEWSQTITEND